MNNRLLFALRLFRRDWRNDELRLLALALALAAAAVTTVGFFTERVNRAMQLQASAVLAADLVLSANDPLPPSFTSEARRLGLQTARVLRFPSVIMHNDRTQLVEVKAVDPNYPLRGELRVRDVAMGKEISVQQPPASGQAWAGGRLSAALGLQPGDRFDLGYKRFQYQYLLSRDTGEAANLFRLGPLLLIPLQDLPATGLVTPASRVRYKLLLAGPVEAVEQYRQWAKTRLPKGVSLQGMSDSRPALRNALERGGRFLSLAALVAVLVAAAAVALASQRFVTRQANASAILRCLGAGRPFILQTLMIRLSLLTLCAGLAGILLGTIAQQLLAQAVKDWFSGPLPAPGLRPLAIGMGTAFITLFGFVLPPILRLVAVPPLRVLRRELPPPPASNWLSGLSAFSAIALLLYWQAGELRLTLLVLGGALLTLILLLGTSRLLISLLTPLRHHGNSTWRYALAGLARNPAITSVQLTGFGIGILALLLLAIVRVDLLTTWQRTIPADAPNQFLINIQPGERKALQRFLAENQLTATPLHPMLRARLSHINGRQVSTNDYPAERARHLLNRQFNLSWSAQPAPDNHIIQGRWWRSDELDESLLSVEQGLAETLGIHLGDRLTFDLAGTPVQGRVSSLRTVKWDSFRPNFFIIATPGLLQEFPASYITSFHLPAGQEALAARLVERFPTITLIDVSALMQQVREIITRGATAVEYVFLFTLAAGLLVLYAGIQASREQRRQEAAILRTLGLQRRRLLLATGIEFFTLGLLAGLLATICASLTGWLVSRELLELNYHFNPWLWLIGLFGSAGLIGIAGLLASYPLVIRPPLQVLREE